MKYLNIFFTLSTIFLINNLSLVASEFDSKINFIKSEIDSGNLKHEKKKIILDNISYLETHLIKKIKQNESRINKYKNNLSSTQDEAESDKLLKKIETLEKKNKKLLEHQLYIEMLKIKAVN